jgi:hypothetical protein
MVVVTVTVTLTGSGMSQPASTMDEQLSSELFICLSSVLRLTTKKNSTTATSAGAVQVTSRAAFENNSLVVDVPDFDIARMVVVTRG